MLFKVGKRASRSVQGIVAVAVVGLCIPAPAAADIVLDWNTTMTTLLQGVPFPAARIAAITQLAVFEAVNAITHEYEPYLPAGTIAAPADASLEAAVATAAHDVLKQYVPASAELLDATLAASLAAIPDGPAKAAGITVGQAAAAAMIARRASDGSQIPQFYTPTSTAAGQWRPTPSCAGTLGRGAFYHWRNVTPFGVSDITAFRLEPPPLMEDGKYVHDFDEVASIGRSDSVLRPYDRSVIAQYYATTSPVTWANSAARQIASAQGRLLGENARALALLNMAISDGAVASFDTKYFYTTWRPETAIHNADIDPSPRTAQDLSYTPFIVAPCFPGYPSGHATLSSSAREVLERLYGPTGHHITLTNPSMPGVVLDYSDFKRICEDIDDARVYGGIHFRFDQEGGARQGRSLGAEIVKRNLRPIQP